MWRLEVWHPSWNARRHIWGQSRHLRKVEQDRKDLETCWEGWAAKLSNPRIIIEHNRCKPQVTQLKHEQWRELWLQSHPEPKSHPLLPQNQRTRIWMNTGNFPEVKGPLFRNIWCQSPLPHLIINVQIPELYIKADPASTSTYWPGPTEALKLAPNSGMGRQITGRPTNKSSFS